MLNVHIKHIRTAVFHVFYIGQKPPERNLEVLLVKCHGLYNLAPTYLSKSLAVVDKYSQTSRLVDLRPFVLPFTAGRTLISFETQLKHLQPCGATSDNTTTASRPYQHILPCMGIASYVLSY